MKTKIGRLWFLKTTPSTTISYNSARIPHCTLTTPPTQHDVVPVLIAAIWIKGTSLLSSSLSSSLSFTSPSISGVSSPPTLLNSDSILSPTPCASLSYEPYIYLSSNNLSWSQYGTNHFLISIVLVIVIILMHSFKTLNLFFSNKFRWTNRSSKFFYLLIKFLIFLKTMMLGTRFLVSIAVERMIRGLRIEEPLNGSQSRANTCSRFVCQDKCRTIWFA